VIGGWLQRHFLGCGVFSGRGASRTKTQCVPNAGQFQTIVIDDQDGGDDVGSVCTEDLRSSVALFDLFPVSFDSSLFGVPARVLLAGPVLDECPRRESGQEENPSIRLTT
jgi:hypothetical protein